MSQEFTSEEMEAKMDAEKARFESEWLERKAMLEPLAMDILTSITNNRPSLNDSDMSKLTKEYTPIYTEVMTMCLEKDVRVGELEYLFKIVRQGIEVLENLVIVSINQKKLSADKKLWGLDHMADLSLQKLDTVLESIQPVKAVSPEVAPDASSADETV